MSNENPAEMTTASLSAMKLPELKALAASRGLKGISQLRKPQLIELLSNDASAPTTQEAAPREETPASSSETPAVPAQPEVPLADKPAVEMPAAEGLRRSRRRRAVSQGAVEPAHVTLDLPLPASERSESTPEPDTTVVETVLNIELPDGVDAANADVAPVASARIATTVRIVRAVRIAKRALRAAARTTSPRLPASSISRRTTPSCVPPATCPARTTST